MSFPQKPVDGQLFKGYIWDDAQGLWVKNETDVIVLNHGDSYKLPLAAEVGDSLVFLLPLANIGVQNSTYIEHAAGAIITRGENKTVEEGAGRVLVRSGQTLELVRKHSIVSKTAPPVIPPEKKDADITTPKEALRYAVVFSFSPNKRYMLAITSDGDLLGFKKKDLYYVPTVPAVLDDYSDIDEGGASYDQTISWSEDSSLFTVVSSGRRFEQGHPFYYREGNVYNIREAPDSGVGDPGVNVRKVWKSNWRTGGSSVSPVFVNRIQMAFSNKDRLLAIVLESEANNSEYKTSGLNVLDFQDQDNPVSLHTNTGENTFTNVRMQGGGSFAWDATKNILTIAAFVAAASGTYPENSIVLARRDYSDPLNITEEQTYENTLLDGASQSVIDALGEDHEFGYFEVILTHPIISSLLLAYTYNNKSLQIYNGRVIDVGSGFSSLRIGSFSPDGRFFFQLLLYSVGAGDVPFNQETEDKIESDLVIWKEDSSGFFVLNNGVVSFYQVQRVYENSWSLVHIEGLPVEDTDFQTITEEG